MSCPRGRTSMCVGLRRAARQQESSHDGVLGSVVGGQVENHDAARRGAVLMMWPASRASLCDRNACRQWMKVRDATPRTLEAP